MRLDQFRLDGRRAVVTGGGTGIGLATARLFSAAGADVIMAGPDADVLSRAKASLIEEGCAASTMLVDVTSPEACEELAQRSHRERGPVDILIANAGISWPDTPAEALTDDAWRRVLDVNVSGTFWTCRSFGRLMLERRRGSIVTTGSISGVISNKPQRQAHYNASKAAVHHLTRSLAGEWADRGVRVNCVAPTYVNTAMSNENAHRPHYFGPWMDNTPMRRMVEAEEIANVILFLASDAASALTGSIVMADAGYTIW